MSPALMAWDVCGVWRCPWVRLVLWHQLAPVPITLCAGSALKQQEMGSLSRGGHVGPRVLGAAESPPSPSLAPLQVKQRGKRGGG